MSARTLELECGWIVVSHRLEKRISDSDNVGRGNLRIHVLKILRKIPKEKQENNIAFLLGCYTWHIFKLKGFFFSQ